MTLTVSNFSIQPCYGRVSGGYNSIPSSWGIVEGTINPQPADKAYSGAYGYVVPNIDFSADLISGGIGTYAIGHFYEEGVPATEQLAHYAKFYLNINSYLDGFFAARLSVASHDTDPTTPTPGVQSSEHFFALGTTGPTDYAVKPGAGAAVPPSGYALYGLQTNNVGTQVSRLECFPYVDNPTTDIAVGDVTPAADDIVNVHKLIYQTDTTLFQDAKALRFYISKDTGGDLPTAGAGFADNGLYVRIIGDTNNGNNLLITEFIIDAASPHYEVATGEYFKLLDGGANYYRFNKIYGWRLLDRVTGSVSTAATDCALLNLDREVTIAAGATLVTRLEPGDAIYLGATLIGIVDYVSSATSFFMRHPYSGLDAAAQDLTYVRYTPHTAGFAESTCQLQYNTVAGNPLDADINWTDYYDEDIPVAVPLSMTFFSEYVLNGTTGITSILLVPENETSPIYPVNPEQATDFPDNRIEQEGGYPHDKYNVTLADYPPIWEHVIPHAGGVYGAVVGKTFTFESDDLAHIGLSVGDHLYNDAAAGVTDPSAADTDMGYVKSIAITPGVPNVNTVTFTGTAPAGITHLYVSKCVRSSAPIWMLRFFRTDVTGGPASVTGMQPRGTSITKA